MNTLNALQVLMNQGQAGPPASSPPSDGGEGRGEEARSHQTPSRLESSLAGLTNETLTPALSLLGKGEGEDAAGRERCPGTSAPSAPLAFSPSPPSDGGEGRGEEARLSSQPSSHWESFLVWRVNETLTPALSLLGKGEGWSLDILARADWAPDGGI